MSLRKALFISLVIALTVIGAVTLFNRVTNDAVPNIIGAFIEDNRLAREVVPEAQFIVKETGELLYVDHSIPTLNCPFELLGGAKVIVVYTLDNDCPSQDAPMVVLRPRGAVWPITILVVDKEKMEGYTSLQEAEINGERVILEVGPRYRRTKPI